jgi:hypothetical protein
VDFFIQVHQDMITLQQFIKCSLHCSSLIHCNQPCQLYISQPHPLQSASSAVTFTKQSGQLPQPRQLQTLFFRSSAERSQTLRAKAECALEAWPFLVAENFVLGMSTPGISNYN